MTGRPASSLTPRADATSCGTRLAISQRRKFDEPNTVGVAVHNFGGGLQGQPRLSQSSHAAQR